MKISYQAKLALPPAIVFDVTWQNDVEVNQVAVDAFVDGLHRPAWYEAPGDINRDMKDFMLNPARGGIVYTVVRDPFTNRDDMRLWQCSQCGCANTYSGIDIGHINNWKAELKLAGVLTLDEAKAAYNNLTNLRIECSTCNSSHDWE